MHDPPRFRDPPVHDEAASLRRELARILVAAPTLPVALPHPALHLVDVEAEDRGVALVLGTPHPIASLVVQGASPEKPLSLRRTAPVVTVALEMRHESAARYSPVLEVMRTRLEASLVADRWAMAQPPLEQLQRLARTPLDQLRQLVPGTRFVEGLVRTGFRCNQDCGMCWQGRHWEGFGRDQILTWIEDLRAAGAEHLSISGGEPTLDASLPDYIRRARALGFELVMLQTNAIQCARPDYARGLHEAGLHEAFVSLHSGDATVSDRVTRAPGTHARTVAGIRALLDAGITVNLNAVMTPETLVTLEGLPAFIRTEFGQHPGLRGLVLTLPIAPFDAALATELIPDPDDVRRVLRATLDRASALGVVIHDLDGPCGPQLCAFDADPRFATLRAVGDVTFRRRLPACNGCSVRDACFGPRLEQIARFGDACAHPLAPRTEDAVARAGPLD